jgi:phage terminase large subunit-like protein
VNPNFGLSIDLARLTPLYEDELPKGDQAIRTWASQHLNIEIGVALQADGWAGGEYWDSQADPTLSLDALLQRCDVITAGVDGGGLDDLFGLALVGRERGTGRWLAWNRAWAHPVVLKRRKDIASRLIDLSAEGDLRIVSRVGEDLDELVSIMTRVRKSGLLPKEHAIGIDPGNSHAAVNALTVAQFPAEQMSAVSQGWKLGGAIKLTERRLAEATLFHAGQGLMAWCVGNAKVEPKGNAMLITKQASGSAKIDPLMALFNGVELMARNPVAVGNSIYETRGIRII